MLGDIVKSCFEKSQEQQKAEGYIKLECGFSTIPLPEIDVPFYSRYLWAGVLPFCTRCCRYVATLPCNYRLVVLQNYLEIRDSPCCNIMGPRHAPPPSPDVVPTLCCTTTFNSHCCTTLHSFHTAPSSVAPPPSPAVALRITLLSYSPCFSCTHLVLQRT